LNINSDDLDAAVAAGVVTTRQADALRDFVATRKAAPVAYGMEDERFRFMRGFNDLFFAIGIALLGAAMIFYLGNATLTYGGYQPGIASAIWLIGAALCWLLAELLIRRMRLVLPGILLSGLFLFFVFMAMPSVNIIGAFQISPDAGSKSFLAQFRGLALSAIPLKALMAAIAMTLFYWRFRLPFALLPIAGSLVVLALAATALFTPAPDDGLRNESLVLLLCGLVVFAVAMRFDLSDRMRTTRRSDCAFWLHLLAAPLIVHSLVMLTTYWLVPWGGSAHSIERMTSNLVGALAAIIALLALLAIVIDRRALLVSALTYLGAIVGYAISQAMGKDTNVFYATLLVLGILILTLGIGWRFLRGIVMRLLPARIVDRLPPVNLGA
jgi:hypothetical protein